MRSDLVYHVLSHLRVHFQHRLQLLAPTTLGLRSRAAARALRAADRWNVRIATVRHCVVLMQARMQEPPPPNALGCSDLDEGAPGPAVP